MTRTTTAVLVLTAVLASGCAGNPVKIAEAERSRAFHEAEYNKLASKPASELTTLEASKMEQHRKATWRYLCVKETHMNKFPPSSYCQGQWY